MSESERGLVIDVVSDVMCPWCYIGKRNLEAAGDIATEISFTVSWRPYQLDPTLPAEGKDRKTYLSEKFGGDEKAGQIYARIREAGHAVQIPFNFEAIAVSPNTLDAHRLIRWAGGQGADVQDRVVTRLFELYFEEGANIGDPAVLADAGSSAGMDRDILIGLLAGEQDVEAVRKEIDVARQLGVTGVPCFIIGQKYAVMGAQPPNVLADAIRRVDAEIAQDAQYTSP